MYDAKTINVNESSIKRIRAMVDYAIQSDDVDVKNTLLRALETVFSMSFGNELNVFAEGPGLDLYCAFRANDKTTYEFGVINYMSTTGTFGVHS